MKQRYGSVALLVLTAGLIALDLDLPVIRPVLALAAMLGLPTLVLFHRVGFLSDHAPARLLYAFGTSLLGLMLVGLLLNTVLPLVGVDRPLQPAVLAVATLLIGLGLLAWWGWGAPAAQLPDPAVVLRRVLDARLELAQTLAVCSAVLAVVGAVRLNNRAGGGVAITALVLAAAALLALMIRPEGSRRRDDLLCLGLVALSLLLATSLRGWSITGHDIQSEYLTFVLTNDAQRWQMSSWENAYNACLSLNILPTVLAQATGLSGVVVFKLLLQAVFALVPAMTFLLAGRFLPRRLALAAAVITMSLPTFYTDMPYLVRQEIAFFFLALLLLAATGRAPVRGRLVLIGLFGVGVVLSHYSTTYVMLLGLGLGMLSLGAWNLVRRTRWLRDRFPGTSGRSELVLLRPALIAMLAVTSWVWAGPITDTGGHAAKVAREAIAAVLGKGEEGPGSSDLGYSLFSRSDAGPRQRLDLFVAETMKARNAAPAKALLIRKPGRAELRPDIVPASRTPLTALGSKLESVGLDAEDTITVVRVVCAGLIQVLLLIGLIWMVRKRRGMARPAEEDEKHTSDRTVPEEAVFLTFGSVAALGVIVLIPMLSVDYGVLRAFQQTLLVVAPVVATGMWVVVRHWKARAAALSVAVPLGLLLVFSGAVPSLLGGYAGRLALSNSGLYYERYYASESDMQAVDWVVAADGATGPPPKIIANRNIGVRVLSARDDARVADRLYPTLLTKGEYVFVDSRLRETGRAAIFYTGDFITYRYPMRNLNRRLDLVYSSELTRIYR
jgi:hypothetical protein